MGGDLGYGEEVLGLGDDGSVLHSLPFTIGYQGMTTDTFFINANGNFTFFEGFGNFTTSPFDSLSQPIIAPFWADIDTSCNDCGQVYRAANQDEGIVAVTWHEVAQYGSSEENEFIDCEPGASCLGGDPEFMFSAPGSEPDSIPKNTFQAVFIDRSEETGTSGDFDLEFRYEKLEWSGSDSYGEEYGANAGFAAGFLPQLNEEQPEVQVASDYVVGPNYLSLPGSLTPEVTELANTSNSGVDGIWTFQFRDGLNVNVGQAPIELDPQQPPVIDEPYVPDPEVPGETFENPLMPGETLEDGGWSFDFEASPGEVVFIDPDVAVGYDYEVQSGPNFAAVTLPSGFDANYELHLWDGIDWVFEANLLAEQEFSFVDFGYTDGVQRFRILGIDTSNMVDPTDNMAFVTGLRFIEAGNVSMTQTAITEFVPDNAVDVSEPSPLMLMMFGISLLALKTRRMKIKRS